MIRHISPSFARDLTFAADRVATVSDLARSRACNQVKRDSLWFVVQELLTCPQFSTREAVNPSPAHAHKPVPSAHSWELRQLRDPRAFAKFNDLIRPIQRHVLSVASGIELSEAKAGLRSAHRHRLLLPRLGMEIPRSGHQRSKE